MFVRATARTNIKNCHFFCLWLCSYNISRHHYQGGNTRMSTTATSFERGARTGPAQTLLLAGARFDWAAAILSAIFTAGLFLDGWAHNHDKVDQSFFTPWHAVFYGGFVLYALFLVGALVANRSRGFGLRQPGVRASGMDPEHRQTDRHR
jgi:hypothetical protein